MKTNTQSKGVDWSYPTSPNAERFGFPDGCWTVHVDTAGEVGREALAGFPTREAALEHAQAIRLPWSMAFLFCHPEFKTAA